jgi:glycosyltransferase involved in cell wall biosynthesis
MRLLIATGLYPPESGGPATYTKLLEERLPALGFEVSVLPFSRVRHLPKVFRHAAYFFKCMHMTRHANVVYAQDTVSVGFPAALAAVVLRKPFFVRVPGDHAWEQARQRFGVQDSLDEFQHKRYGWRVEFLRSLALFTVRRATKVVVPSEYMKRIVSAWTSVPVVRIYSSIDLALAHTLPAHRPEGFLVVSSGRPVPWKNFDAVERVVAQEPAWQFFLAKDLPRAEALGWVKAADVFVLNSTYEGLPHALIEAIALGTPIVATRVGGNQELIEDGTEGLLIPVNDEKALHAALIKISSDPVTARARAEAARSKLSKFSINTTIKEISSVLHTP